MKVHTTPTSSLFKLTHDASFTSSLTSLTSSSICTLYTLMKDILHISQVYEVSMSSTHSSDIAIDVDIDMEDMEEEKEEEGIAWSSALQTWILDHGDRMKEEELLPLLAYVRTLPKDQREDILMLWGQEGCLTSSQMMYCQS